VSLTAVSLSLLAGCSIAGGVWSVFSLGREIAVWNWVRGTGRRQGFFTLALMMAGRSQEKLPGVRRFSVWLNRRQTELGGAAEEDSAVNLARKELLVLGGLALFAWLAESVPIGLAGAGAAFLVPDLLAKASRERRQEEIRRDLPDVLSLISLGVDSGLSLDAGLRHVSEEFRHGPIPAEIGRMLGEVRFGARRHHAWREMARRMKSPELSEVVEALVQADQMGTGLSQSLRALEEQARGRHRQHLEEQAGKAPVKLIFPLTFCIFPSVFIVLLGPVFLSLLGVVR
jgi:Flp pilus assembly protein TadB